MAMTDAYSPEYHAIAFQLLVDLRGGLPERCDFCRRRYSAIRYPVPEEGGEWACSVCVARWAKEAP